MVRADKGTDRPITVDDSGELISETYGSATRLVPYTERDKYSLSSETAQAGWQWPKRLPAQQPIRRSHLCQTVGDCFRLVIPTMRPLHFSFS